jgi:hypothetical protein
MHHGLAEFAGQAGHREPEFAVTLEHSPFDRRSIHPYKDTVRGY